MDITQDTHYADVNIKTITDGSNLHILLSDLAHICVQQQILSNLWPSAAPASKGAQRRLYATFLSQFILNYLQKYIYFYIKWIILHIIYNIYTYMYIQFLPQHHIFYSVYFNFQSLYLLIFTRNMNCHQVHLLWIFPLILGFVMQSCKWNHFEFTLTHFFFLLGLFFPEFRKKWKLKWNYF